MKISTALLTIGATFALAVSAAPHHGEGHHGGPHGDKLSQRLQNKITLRGLTRHTNMFQDLAIRYSNGTRAFGTAAHNATIQYIADQTKHHYDVTIQPAVFTYTETVSETANIVSDNNADLKPILMTYSSSTPAEGVTAEAFIVPNLGCDAADYAGVEGKIAIVSRGTCAFGDKSAAAANAGAVGLLVYNNEEGELNGTLGGDDIPKVPSAGITMADGQRIVELASNGPVTIKLVLVEFKENRSTANVCAETKRGDKHNVIVIGAHSDSVAAGPGINDNGSGSAALLEIARQFHSIKPTNAVRFCWWSAEEFGLLGATHYVSSLTEAQIADIKLYLNFDMIASPNYVNAIYDGDGDAFGVAGPGGSAAIEKLFIDYFAQHNSYSEPSEFDGRSDYGPFMDVGIPCGGTFTGAEGLKTEEQAQRYGGTAGAPYDECYHAACDTTENLNHEAFLLHSKAIAHAVATYSMSTADVDAQLNRTITKRDAAAPPVSSQIGATCGSNKIVAI
ncbi:putative aminopeptidase Y [Dichotomocladium elegans]|nr:putative aminopeptidase Y [Dichotomocladium elegans]